MVDHPLAPLEDADPPPGASLPRAHLRRARQRPLRPPGERRTRSTSSPPTRSPSWTPRRRSGRRSYRSRSVRSARCCWRPSSPSGWTRPSSSARPSRWPSGRRPGRSPSAWGEELDTDEGWAKYNRHYWLKDYKGFLEFFFSQMFNEPHSTKPIEDAVGWGLETTRRDAHRHQAGRGARRGFHARAGRPPALPGAGDPGIAGRDHRSRPRRRARGGDRRRPRHARGLGPRPARARSGQGQSAPARVPRRRAPPARWVRGKSRRKRALYISSPIGLGHARRDVAIAEELRTLHPDLEIDWLAQDPVTRVLEASGETIHPASKHLANESGHIESESAEHDLHCFQAIRRMDEILLANYMVFDDLVRERAVRPLDRRRGVGARLLPARESRAEAGRLRVAHRLRRLAADGRRRRA